MSDSKTHIGNFSGSSKMSDSKTQIIEPKDFKLKDALKEYIPVSELSNIVLSYNPPIFDFEFVFYTLDLIDQSINENIINEDNLGENIPVDDLDFSSRWVMIYRDRIKMGFDFTFTNLVDEAKKYFRLIKEYGVASDNIKNIRLYEDSKLEEPSKTKITRSVSIQPKNSFFTTYDILRGIKELILEKSLRNRLKDHLNQDFSKFKSSTARRLAEENLNLTKYNSPFSININSDSFRYDPNSDTLEMEIVLQ